MKIFETLIISTFVMLFYNSLVYSQIINEEDPLIKKMKNEWIEQSHRIEPGIDWKFIEWANQEAYQLKLLNSMKDENSLLNVTKTFADDQIIAEWIEKGSKNLAGRIHNVDVDFDNNLIYAASSGGNVWKGNIDGTNWKCLNNTLRFPDIRAVKLINNRLIVAKNGATGVFYTDNDGNTWKKSSGLENAEKWGNIKRAEFVKNKIFLLVNEWDYNAWKSITSIYTSNDLGISFTKIYSINLSVSACDLWSDKVLNNELYMLHNDTISIINSDGSFKFKNSFNKNSLKVTPDLLKGNTQDGKTNLVIYGASGDSSFYYESIDFGKNWSYLGGVKCKVFETNSFYVSILDKKLISVGGVEVFKTINGGSIWSKINGWGEYYGDIVNKLHADIPSIMSFLDKTGKEVFFISTDGGLYVSYDQMKTVKNISLEDLNVSQYYSSYTYKGKNGITFAGAQDQGFQRSLIDDGKILSFEQTISGDYGHLTSADGGDHLWSVYPGFAMVYWNVTKSPMNSAYWNFKGKNWLWMPPIIADLSDPYSAFIASGGITSSDTKLWRLTLENNKIVDFTYDFDFSEGKGGNKISAFTQSKLDNSYLYVMTDNNYFFKSTDGGETWSKNSNFKSPGIHYFYGNTIIASNKQLGKIWVLGSNYSSAGAYMSNDNGNNFIKIDSGLAKTLIYKAAITDDEKFIFAATEAGPFVYSVDKNLWYSLQNEVSPQQTFWSVEYLSEANIARFVTYGRGIWDFKINNFSNVELSNKVNNNINLIIYPNPVSNQSTVKFNLSKSGYGKVSIYKYDGMLIKEIENKYFIEGDNEYKFNLNENVPAGQYICVLFIDGKIYYTKLVKI